jgi:hypothetical protein
MPIFNINLIIYWLPPATIDAILATIVAGGRIEELYLR